MNNPNSDNNAIDSTRAVQNNLKQTKKSTSVANLKRIENTVNTIFEEVEKIKNNSLYSDDVPEAEAALSAITKGNQNLRRVVIAKSELDDSSRAISKITKSFSKLASMIESIEISDSDSDHLIGAINSAGKDLSSHIGMIKRKADKNTRFSF